jgi:hypothetical protein
VELKEVITLKYEVMLQILNAFGHTTTPKGKIINVNGEFYELEELLHKLICQMLLEKR